MKRTAFLQALLICFLLLVSWVLLLTRMQDSKTEEPEKPSVRGESPEREVPEQTTPPSRQGERETLPTPGESPIPANWSEWWTYLENIGSPREMRIALDQLRESLQSLPQAEAIERILDLLESGADMRTGLAFQIGPEASLLGANSLRAILLDLLHELDPEQAAALAERELDAYGTSLVPDVYVIHMRNLVGGEELSASESRSRLKTHFRELLHHRPWVENPTTAIAEAMDVAVYTEATELVPELASLMKPEQSQLLRHAAGLALERLVDRKPRETLGQLLETADRPTDLKKARSGYFARLDPDMPGAESLLESYLEAPGVDREEAAAFLRSFPNLNQSFSHNLLSTNISNTEPGGHIHRLESALELVESWQLDPGFSHLQDVLSETEERIKSQLYSAP